MYQIIENQKNHKEHVVLYPLCVFVCTLKEAYVFRIRPSATTRGGHRSWMAERGLGRPLVQRTINPSRRHWWSFRSSSSAALTDWPRTDPWGQKRSTRNAPTRRTQRGGERERRSPTSQGQSLVITVGEWSADENERERTDRQKVYVSTAAAFDACAVSIRFAIREESCACLALLSPPFPRVFPGQHPGVVEGEVWGLVAPSHS